MKLQNENPYDSFLLGINDMYYPIGIDKFYLNTPFVEVNFDIVITGKTYVLIHTDRESILRLKIVNVIDVYYDTSVMNILCLDLVTGKRLKVEFDIYQKEDECSFRLVEADYLQKKIMFLTNN